MDSVDNSGGTSTQQYLMLDNVAKAVARWVKSHDPWGLTRRLFLRRFEVQRPRCIGRGATCRGSAGSNRLGSLGDCNFSYQLSAISYQPSQTTQKRRVVGALIMPSVHG